MLERQIVIYQPDEDGWWVVTCPSLAGCVSQGRSREEAIANIQEAIVLYLESLAAHGEPIPEEVIDSVVMV